MKYAAPNMVLGLPVYDNSGNLLFPKFATLSADSIKEMKAQDITEIMVDDWRTADVPVMRLYSPEVEGRLVGIVRKLMTENTGKQRVAGGDLEEMQVALNALCREVAFDAVMGCQHKLITNVLEYD